MESEMETVKDCVKDYLIILFKESAKFALLGIVSLLSMTLLLGYLLVEILKIDINISGVIIGIITAITIFIIDNKKIHSFDKINDAHVKLFKRIIKRV